MKTENIVATTHLDTHNGRITREALEQAAMAINSGDKPLLTVNHDVAIPPYGKMLTAKVEPYGDGEYKLVSENEVFEKTEWFIPDEGPRLFKQESENSTAPFVDRYERLTPQGYEISLDPINFDSFDAKESFVEEVKTLTGVDFTEADFGRKAAIPDPEIVIKLAEAVIAYLLAKDAVKKIADKVVDKVGDAIADDFAKFYGFVKATITTYAKYVRPRNRPVTYIFIAPLHPRIEFVARTSNPDFVLSALMSEKLKDALARAEHLEQTLGATRIQFLLSQEGEWEFNYLLTKAGGVIGTEKALSNRVRKVELLFPKEKQPKRKK